MAQYDGSIRISTKIDDSDVKSGIEKIKKGLQRLQSLTTNLLVNVDSSEAESRLNEVESDANNLDDIDPDININVDPGSSERIFSELGNDVNETSDNVDDLSDNLDDASDHATSFGEIFTASVAGQAVVSGVKNLISGIGEIATQASEASGMIQAKLGLTTKEAKKLTDTSKKIWSDGFGDNVQEVNDDLATVRQYLGDISDNDLQDILENAEIVKKVFGADVSESVKSAKTMMDNFGISSSDAFDLITVGYQNGLDYSGEFLDTLNEYSPQFSAMGLSAQDAMKMMENGVDAGAFSLDKVADAMKEFNIRIKDGSTTTSEGLSLIGLNVDEISKKLADGSMTSGQAMQLVISSLENTDDKVTQNIAGVDLFGTQWEDTTSDVILALDDTNDSLSNVEGATKKAGDAANDNIGTNFKKAIRGLQDAVEPLAEKMLDFANNVMPKVQTALQWVSDNGSIIAASIAGIVTAIAGFKIAGTVLGLVKSFKEYQVATETATVIQWAFNAAVDAFGGPIGLAITLIAAAVSAIIVLWNTNEDFRNTVINIWNTIKDTVSTVIGAIVGFFTETIPNAIQTAIDWFTSIPENILSALSSVVDSLAGWASDIISWVAEAIPAIIDSIVSFFSELPYKIGYAIGYAIGTLVSWAASVISWVVTNVPNIIEAIINFFVALPGRIYNAIITVLSSFASWVSSMIASAKTNIPKIISAIISFFKSLPGKIYSAIVGAIGRLAAWASSMLSTAKAKIPAIISTIVGFFKELPGKMLTIGENVVKGFWKGVTSFAKWLWDNIKGFGSGIVDGFKKALGIHSPSKVMADEVGKYIPAGIAVGMLSAAPLVKSAISSLSDMVTSSTRNMVKNYNKIYDPIFDDLKQKLKNGELDQDKYASSVSSSYDDLFSDLKQDYKDGKIDFKTFIAEMESARNRYLDKNTDKWQTSYDDLSDNIKDTMSDTLKDIKSDYDSEISSIQNNIKSMASRLSDIDLVTSSTSDGKTTYSFLDIDTLEDGNDEIETLSDNLQKLKDADIPDSLLSEVANMDTDEANAYAQYLLTLLDNGEWDNYMAAWNDRQELAKQTAQDYYSDQLSTLNDEYTEKIVDQLNTLTGSATDIGGNTAIGLAKGILSGKSNVIQAAEEVAEAAIQAANKTLGIASPSKVFRKIGKYMGLGLGIGFTDTKDYVSKTVKSAIPTSLNNIGFNINGTAGISSIPKLAQGAVIPPNREFLSVLGDQKSGTNIETPLETMIAAFKSAITEIGGIGSGEITLNVTSQLDGKTIARNQVRYLPNEYKRIGKNVVKVGSN